MGPLALLLLNLLFVPVAAGFLLLFLLSPRRALLKNLFHELPERLALRTPTLPQGALWLHAASVGETKAMVLLVRRLRAEKPGAPILISCSTEAGKKAALSLSPDAAVLAPLDFYPISALFVSKLRPGALFIMERDLWPNMITAADRAGIPVCVVNGRMSRRSAKRYALASFFMSYIFGKVSMICAQSEDDATRYGGLGMNPARITVCGNLKYDLLNRAPAVPERLSASFSAFLNDGAKLLVAGSTHPQEEELLAESFKPIKAAAAGFKIALAPRHLERMEQTLRIFENAGLRTARLSISSAQDLNAADCLVIDTMGQLSACYGFAHLCFIGGSIAQKGGHNMLEAAILGKPLIIGPHYYNTPEVAAKLLEAGGAFKTSAHEFARDTARLISHGDALSSAGKKALEAAESFTGATEKTLPALMKVLK